MKILRREAESLRAAWLGELQAVAAELGYVPNMVGDCDHPIVQILGGTAWGRHPEEGGPDETKDNVLIGLGYLKGIRDAAMRAARVLKDQKADKLLVAVPGKVRRRVYR